jgi:hypothetical protein
MSLTSPQAALDEFLSRVGLSQYAQTMRNQDVNSVEVARALSVADLQECGMSPADAATLFAALNPGKIPVAAAPPPPAAKMGAGKKAAAAASVAAPPPPVTASPPPAPPTVVRTTTSLSVVLSLLAFIEVHHCRIFPAALNCHHCRKFPPHSIANFYTASTASSVRL